MTDYEYGMAPAIDDAPVSVNAAPGWDEEVVYDETVESLQGSLLPPEVKGGLRVKYKLGNRGFSPADLSDGPLTSKKTGKRFFMVHLQGEVIAPGEYYNNANVFTNATSLIFESAKTSPIHQWLKSIGQPAPARATLQELYGLVQNAIAGEPIGTLKGRWEASVEDGETEGGKKKYKTVLKGMRNFPALSDGRHNPEVSVNGQTVTAQFNVTDFVCDAKDEVPF